MHLGKRIWNLGVLVNGISDTYQVNMGLTCFILVVIKDYDSAFDGVTFIQIP